MTTKEDSEIVQKGISLDDRIGISGLLVAFLTLVLALFAYLVNARLGEMQLQSHRQQVAESYQRFWQQISDLEKQSVSLSSSLGSASGAVTVAAFGFMNELPQSFPDDELGKAMFMVDNPRLAAKWFEYVSAHGEFVASIESVASSYDNSILVYGKVVNELGIYGWSAYAKQQPEVWAWKRDLLAPYEKMLLMINNIVSNKQLPTNFDSKVTETGRELGLSIGRLAPPYMKGLMELKAANLAQLLQDT